MRVWGGGGHCFAARALSHARMTQRVRSLRRGESRGSSLSWTSPNTAMPRAIVTDAWAMRFLESEDLELFGVCARVGMRHVIMSGALATQVCESSHVFELTHSRRAPRDEGARGRETNTQGNGGSNPLACAQVLRTRVR